MSKLSGSTYTDRERELIEEGYDPSQAAEIAADERGRKRFEDEMRGNVSDEDD